MNKRCFVASHGSYHIEAGVLVWKRVLDLGCILLATPILGPVMLCISGMIKLLSPGPVFFRQERIGLGGQPFTCLKFRTMRHGACTNNHQDYLKDLTQSDKPMVKLDNMGDGRLIPFAWILRSTGLDELPQIINVIRGEMSLVGPRPCLAYEYALYKPEHRERFSVLPGLTGLWQVSGKNNTTFERMIQLDIDYARNPSVLRDLWIMAKTPAVLLWQFMEGLGRRKGIPAENPDTTTSVASATDAR